MMLYSASFVRKYYKSKYPDKGVQNITHDLDCHLLWTTRYINWDCMTSSPTYESKLAVEILRGKCELIARLNSRISSKIVNLWKSPSRYYFCDEYEYPKIWCNRKIYERNSDWNQKYRWWNNELIKRQPPLKFVHSTVN
jgi:hypothetical protein